MYNFRLMTIALVSLFFLFQACDQVENATPGSVVLNYWDAKLRGDYTKAYSLISSKDQAVQSLTEFKEQEDDGLGQAVRLTLQDKISYSVLRTTETENSATVEVEVTMPNIMAMMFGALGAFFSADEENRDEVINKRLEELLDKNELPMMTEVTEIELIKEGGQWRVFLDLESQRLEAEKAAREEEIKNQERARVEKISELVLAAEELKLDKEFSVARKKYLEVLELDGENPTAIKGIESIDREIELLKQKEAYLEKIELYDFEADFIETYTGKKAGVRFKLRNRGDRVLHMVKVTVYFRDEGGTTIFEDDFHPVNVSGFSFSLDAAGPLKPNYIWQLESGKYYIAENIPSEWKPGNAFARITEIEFEGE